MQMTFAAGAYAARPLDLTWSDAAGHAAAAWKAAYILRRCSAHEAFFSDYMKDTPAAKAAVVATLGRQDAMLWEVVGAHGDSAAAEIDILGILRLSEVQPGCSAKAHYFFFDGRLADKTALLQAWKAWAFGPANLHRVTIEVPAFAKALASHAKKHLGFIEEGCMKDAIKWRGAWHDVHILGCLSDQASNG